MIDQTDFVMIQVKHNNWQKHARLTATKTIKTCSNLKYEMLIHKADVFKVHFSEHTFFRSQGCETVTD